MVCTVHSLSFLLTVILLGSISHFLCMKKWRCKEAELIAQRETASKWQNWVQTLPISKSKHSTVESNAFFHPWCLNSHPSFLKGICYAHRGLMDIFVWAHILWSTYKLSRIPLQVLRVPAWEMGDQVLAAAWKSTGVKGVQLFQSCLGCIAAEGPRPTTKLIQPILLIPSWKNDATYPLRIRWCRWMKFEESSKVILWRQ